MVDGLYRNLLATYNQYPAVKSNYNNRKTFSVTNYQKIINKTPYTPTYIINPNYDSKVFALKLKTDALNLNSQVKMLSQNNDISAFNSKTANVDIPNVINVSIIDDDYSKLPDEFNFKVNSLAKEQVNTGCYVLSNVSVLSNDTFDFNVNINDDIYNFYIDTKDKSNFDIQDEICSSINDADIGLEAYVETNPINQEHSRIVIKSNNTGDLGGLTFELNDVLNSDDDIGIVEFFELNNITQYPSNSSFEYNGENKQSLSNSIILNKALRIDMLNPSDDVVNISYNYNNSKILDAIHSLADSYNKFVELSKDTQCNKVRIDKLSNDLNNMTKNCKNSLEACGIDINVDDYSMSINDSLVKQAINDGELQDLFLGENGITNKIIKITDNVSFDPMEYIEKTMVTYPNYLKRAFPNPYVSSIYSGMLFSGYC